MVARRFFARSPCATAHLGDREKHSESQDRGQASQYALTHTSMLAYTQAVHFKTPMQSPNINRFTHSDGQTNTGMPSESEMAAKTKRLNEIIIVLIIN